MTYVWTVGSIHEQKSNYFTPHLTESNWILLEFFLVFLFLFSYYRSFLFLLENNFSHTLFLINAKMEYTHRTRECKNRYPFSSSFFMCDSRCCRTCFRSASLRGWRFEYAHVKMIDKRSLL